MSAGLSEGTGVAARGAGGAAVLRLLSAPVGWGRRGSAAASVRCRGAELVLGAVRVPAAWERGEMGASLTAARGWEGGGESLVGVSGRGCRCSASGLAAFRSLVVGEDACWQN